MKKFLVILLVALIMFPLTLVGLVYLGYVMTDDSTVPKVQMKVMDTTLDPAGYEWYSPVFGGIRYKQFYETVSGVPADAGVLKESSILVDIPSNFTSSATLQRDGEVLWQGSGADLGSYRFIDNGEYVLSMELARDAEQGQGYGSFSYKALFHVKVEPRIEVSATALQQGGVGAVRLYNLAADAQPAVDSELGHIIFTADGSGTMTAFVPVDYQREPGDYEVRIVVGSYTWDVVFTVEEGDFERQDMEIDTSDTVITEANSYYAYQQYNETIPPFYETTDDTLYWTGRFIEPKSGPLTTPFGVFRYTNGSDTPSRHAGIDIDGNTGDTVVAPNGGRVVYADTLLNTGNTIVIEHGGGLKSYFFHLDSLAVREGDLVTKGQEIGTLGTTGYSTGPHLHYEARIGAECINPTELFEGTSGLYYFVDKEEEAA